jgi:hypothetical protein
LHRRHQRTQEDRDHGGGLRRANVAARRERPGGLRRRRSPDGDDADFYRIESSNYDRSSYNRFLTMPLDNGGGRLKLPGGVGLGLDFVIYFVRHHAVDGFAG